MRDKETKIKIVCLLMVFIMCGIVIIAKLYFVQIKNHHRFDAKALNQYKGRAYSNTSRGNIYDRNMQIFATNIQVKSVYANPNKIKNAWRAAKSISTILGLPGKKIKNKLKRQDKYFVYIKRKVTPEEYKRLKDEKISGIEFLNENKRFYPKMELGATTIGFAGIDNQGLSGIEYSFNDHLSKGGKWVRFQKDRYGRPIELAMENPVFSQGESSIVLTIDEVIQYYAFKAIKEKVIETSAKRGLAIVMDPSSGELLAIAQYPSYNANLYSNYPSSQTNNWAVSDSIEPGSTFKMILASAALEEKRAQPKDIFFCENGSFDIGGIVIHEANKKKYRLLTFTEVIGKSSNIGAVKIARRLGQKKFYKYIKKFGFGRKTDIDLPGESRGLVRKLSKWSQVSLGSIAMGQEISVTPIQLATAVSSIANGGFLMKPLIVKQVIQNGRVIKKFSPEIVRKTISSETAETMKKILSYTIDHGTGKKAIIPGYKVGGKTGTAQKIDPDTKKYSPDKYVASFVGFAPLENPKITVLVIVDEPQGIYWGGSIAAPVFQKIAKKTLKHLNVPSTMNHTYSVAAITDNKMKGALNIDLKPNPAYSLDNPTFRQNLDKVLGKLLNGFKKYFWEIDKALVSSSI